VVPPVTLTTNGTRILEYDDENQLTRVTEPTSWKSEFTYDGKLRMRISKDFAWVAGAWVQTNEVRRVYDGMLVLQERDQFNVPKLTYTRGKDLSGSLEGAGGIEGLLALTDHSSSLAPSASSLFFHADGNGNITALVDTNQNVVARYLYDPFGNTLSATGPKAALNKYRFSSKEWHAASGMVYYGYRYYIPELQRWPNRDPLEEEGGINLYGFNFNDVLNRIDTDGRGSIAHPANAAIAAEAEAAALGYPSAAAMRAAVKAAALAAEIARHRCLRDRCKKEWEEALKKCAEELAKANPDTAYKPHNAPASWDVNDCARGHVSVECGGNPTPPPKKKKRKLWIFD